MTDFDQRDRGLDSVEALRKEVQVCNSEIARLNGQLDIVLSSLSWRLTKPLRVMARIIRYPKPTLGDIANRVFSGKPDRLKKVLKKVKIMVNELGDDSVYANVVEKIVQKFYVTEAFVESYFGCQNIDLSEYKDYENIYTSLDALRRMYVDFALTTTIRGKEAVSLLMPYLSYNLERWSKPRYLDVGCGYGGFLRAFAEKGFHVTGLELLHNLADFSRLNTNDIPNAKIIEADLLTYPIDLLGKFECVTCNDVIEHVEDAGMALDRLAAIVSQDGVLFMEIPNRDCIDFVISDGHFKIFAINCLNRQDAAKYHEELTNNSGYLNGMGEFYPLYYYVDTLSGKGFDVEFLPHIQTCKFSYTPKKVLSLEEAYQDWRHSHATNLTKETMEIVEKAFKSYKKQLDQDLQLAYLGKEGPFITKYLTSFWRLVARRRS